MINTELEGTENTKIKHCHIYKKLTNSERKLGCLAVTENGCGHKQYVLSIKLRQADKK